MLDYSARLSTALKNRFIQVTFEFKPLLAQTEFCLFQSVSILPNYITKLRQVRMKLIIR